MFDDGIVIELNMFFFVGDGWCLWFEGVVFGGCDYFL